MLGAAGPAVAEPECIARCEKLAASGQLKAGVSAQGCIVRVCQEDARRLYREGEYDAAMASLEPLRPKLSQSPAFLLDQGLIQYALGDFEGALTSFTGVQEGFAESLRAGTQRAHTLVRLGRLDEAAAQFQEMIDLKGAEREFRGLRTRSYLLGNLAVIELARGEHKRSRELLEEAVEIDGRNRLASTYRHRVLPGLEDGRIDERGVLELMIASEDAGLGRNERAERTLDALLARKPRVLEPWMLQTEIQRNRHRYRDCEQTARAGERALGGSVDLAAERIRCTLLRVGPTSAAARPHLDELEALRETYPENTKVRQLLHALDRG